MQLQDERERRRTKWFWAALQKFCAEGRPNVYCSHQVAESLARKYYVVLERDIRPRMKGNGLIECAKIISNAEYCIFASLPIRIRDHVGFRGVDEARQNRPTLEINVSFAIFLATAILEKHLKNAHSGAPSINALVARRAAFLREHRKCLLNQPPPTKESFPVFFNAQIWNAIHDICILDPTGAFQVEYEQGKSNSANGEDLVSLSP